MSFQRLNGITSATSTEQGQQLIRPLGGAGTPPPQVPPSSGAFSPPTPQPTDNSTSRLTGLGGSQQPPPMSQQMMNTVQRPGGNPFGLQVPPQLVQTVVQRIMTGFPGNVALERTPDVEQMLAGRFMAALTGVPGNLPPGGQEALFLAVMDDILGFGPLEPFLQDDSITEIMVNGPEQVWVERKGHPTETGVKFLNEEHVMRVAQRVVAPLGRKLDRQWPMVDARLPDGSRVNIITTPCALQGTTITIRKFFKTPLTVERLIEFGTISAQMAEFLRACVIGKLNIVVAGGTGSGKTTLLNVLSSFIPEGQRI